MKTSFHVPVRNLLKGCARHGESYRFCLFSPWYSRAFTSGNVCFPLTEVSLCTTRENRARTTRVETVENGRGKKPLKRTTNKRVPLTNSLRYSASFIYSTSRRLCPLFPFLAINPKHAHVY